MIALQALLVVVFLGVWEAGARAGLVSAFLVGSPVGIWKIFLIALANGSLLDDTWTTLFEAILGFVLGTAAGSAVGLGLWYSPFVARLVEPFVVAINSVPKIAFAPIVILWFGTGLVSKVALAVSLTSIVALIAAYQAAKDSDIDLQALLLTFGATKHQVFLESRGAVDTPRDHRDLPHQRGLRPRGRGGRRIHLVAEGAGTSHLHRIEPVRPEHSLARALHPDADRLRPVFRDRRRREGASAVEAAAK